MTSNHIIINMGTKYKKKTKNSIVYNKIISYITFNNTYTL